MREGGREGEVVLPITILFRFPSRWRVAMQRFYLEDLRLEERE
jgi:hypothetical protein